MAEILVKAIDAVNSNPDKDKGCYKRGMPAVVMEDGHVWGNGEQPPACVIIKVPLILADKLQKYINMWQDTADPDKPVMIKRRLWTIRWNDLPAGAKTKLINNGELTIKATANYTGAYDYTWAQIKTYFRNQQTNLDETEVL